MIQHLVCKRSLALLSSAALAQVAAAAAAPVSEGSDWQFRAGVAVGAKPRYEGASELRALPLPVLEARWREHFFISTLRGAGYEQRLGGGASVSAALAPDMAQRRAKDGVRLQGLDEVKIAPALRLGAELAFGPVSVKARSSSRIGADDRRGSRGTHAELELGYGLQPSAGLALSLGVNATLMDRQLGQALFGVDAAESARSGLRAHQVGAGLHSLGLFAQGNYRLDEQWQLFFKVGMSRLRGDAAESPIIEKKTQPSLLAAVSRPF